MGLVKAPRCKRTYSLPSLYYIIYTHVDLNILTDLFKIISFFYTSKKTGKHLWVFWNILDLESCLCWNRAGSGGSVSSAFMNVHLNSIVLIIQSGLAYMAYIQDTATRFWMAKKNNCCVRYTVAIHLLYTRWIADEENRKSKHTEVCKHF